MIELFLTILSTIILHGSSIPQFIKNYKRKTTEDISIGLWLMVFTGYILLLMLAFITDSFYFKIIYGIGIVNVGTLIIQILYYKK